MSIKGENFKQTLLLTLQKRNLLEYRGREFQSDLIVKIVTVQRKNVLEYRGREFQADFIVKIVSLH